jgi:hypothetical protein
MTSSEGEAVGASMLTFGARQVTWARHECSAKASTGGRSAPASPTGTPSRKRMWPTDAQGRLAPPLRVAGARPAKNSGF